MSPSSKHLLIRTLTGMALIALAFSGIMSWQLISTYRLMQLQDPLDNKILEYMVKQTVKDRSNEDAKKTVRQLDQQTRAAFFRLRGRLTAGRSLLIIGLVVMIGSGAAAFALHRRPPMPAACAGTGENEFREAGQGRRFLIVSAALCILLAGGLLLYLPDSLQENLGLIQKDGPIGDEPRVLDPGTPLPSDEELQSQWVAFRGWQGSAVSTGRRPVTACNIKTGKNVLWKTPIPAPGYSSPIVWKDKVFVTGGTDVKRELLCFNGDDGALLWSHAAADIEGSPAEAPEVSDDTGYAAATAATDGLRVYAVFATGDLIACDMNGVRVWGVSLGVPANHYGHSASLIMHGRLLIVQFYHAEESILFAFDGATGETVWEVDRDPDISWSSPVIMPLGDKDLLLVNSSSDIRAYDPETGKELWKNDCLGDEVGPSPAYSGTTVFAAQANVALTAINAATGESLWDTANVDLPDTSSPLASGTRLYLASPGLYVSCVNTVDGELKWEHEVDGMCYSSPVLVGGNVYLFDMKGTMYVFEDSDTFKLVNKSAFNETIVATPAFVDDRIYVRGNKHLFCIAEKPGP